MSDIGTAEDLVLEGEALVSAGPCVEEGVGRVVVPTKGKLFDSDGRVEVAIIRPCISRGKRLSGLPPIYEASMLGRNASVFTDWHMWMGHMSQPLREAIQELEEQLQEAITPRRLFSELGGRVTETWFDPTFRAKYDDSVGYRPGAVMGRVIPYPAARQILEADPDGLHVSIAAWPTSARAAAPSWDASQRGMAIEGFRSSPRGSVDWVLRGGAGGRPVTGKLTEAEEAAVTALAEFYSVDEQRTVMEDFSNMTPQQLQEAVAAKNPELARYISVSTPLQESKANAAPPAPTLTREQVEAMLTEHDSSVNANLEESATQIEEAVESRLAELRSAEVRSKSAHKVIEAADLPPTFKRDLLHRYSVHASGPSPVLLLEDEGDRSGDDRVLEAVKEDIAHARELIAESQGGPRVSGLGGSRRAPKRGADEPNAFLDWLKESKGGEVRDEDLAEMVQEGMV